MYDVTLTAAQYWNLRRKLEKLGRSLDTGMGVTGDKIYGEDGYAIERVAILNHISRVQLSVWAEVDDEAGILSFIDAPQA